MGNRALKGWPILSNNCLVYLNINFFNFCHKNNIHDIYAIYIMTKYVKIKFFVYHGYRRLHATGLLQLNFNMENIPVYEIFHTSIPIVIFPKELIVYSDYSSMKDNV